MITFDRQWLAVREAVDKKSRNIELSGKLEDHWRTIKNPRIIDLGCGFGSNFILWDGFQRKEKTTWILCDTDPEIMRSLFERLCSIAVEKNIKIKSAEFPSGFTSSNDSSSINSDSEYHGSPFDFHLLTSSSDIYGYIGDPTGNPEFFTDTDIVLSNALLDILTKDWIQHFHDRILPRINCAYFSHNYSGVFEIDPMVEGWKECIEKFNLDQISVKVPGSTPCLGYKAVDEFSELITNRNIFTGNSDWLLSSPQDRTAIAKQLEFTKYFGTESLSAKLKQLNQSGNLKMKVGHSDLLII